MRKEPDNDDYGTVVMELIVVLGIILGSIMFVTVVTTNVWDAQPKEVEISYDHRVIPSEDAENGQFVLDVFVLDRGNVDRFEVRGSEMSENKIIFEEQTIINDRIDPHNGQHLEFLAITGDHEEIIGTVTIPEGL